MSASPKPELTELRIEEIRVIRNVRRHFDEEGLQQLAQSILDHGIIEPLIVRFVLQESGQTEYHLVAGERRLRAAKIAGLERVPVIVRAFDSATAAKVQLLENLQRQDIDPIEEAEGYDRLIREHGLRARAIAQELGVSEAHISNRRRLLRLPDTVLQEISHKNLSPSVALSLVDLAGNAELAAKAATTLIEQNATQERAPQILDDTLVRSCPVVQWSGYAYGSRQQTCDQGAHKDCPCRRRIKPQYSSECVVCIDPQQYAEVEGAAQAKLDEKQRKAVAKAEAAAEEGVLDLKALKWVDYGDGSQYRNVTSPYGGGKTHTCDADHSQCACLRRGKGPHENEGTRLICIDPKQFQRIERSHKREQTKTAIAAMATENEQLSVWALGEIEQLQSEGLSMILGLADLAYLAAWVFSACDIGTGPNYVPRADRKQYLEGLGITVDKLPSYLATERRRLANAFVAVEDPEKLLRIIYEWPLIAQGNTPGALGQWYRQQIDPEPVAAEKPPQHSDDPDEGLEADTEASAD